MKKLIPFSLFLLCFTNLVFSQNDKTLFQNNLEMSASWAGISFTTTQIMATTTNQIGVDVGFEYNGTFLTGYQWRSTLDELVLPDLAASTQLKFGYHTFLIGYTLPTNKVIHPRLTLGVGPGQMKFDDKKDQLFVVQPAVGLEINLFQWMRLSLDGGYRKVSGVQSDLITNEELTNFFGTASLRFGWSWKKNH